jgi:hypothetical protein
VLCRTYTPSINRLNFSSMFLAEGTANTRLPPIGFCFSLQREVCVVVGVRDSESQRSAHLGLRFALFGLVGVGANSYVNGGVLSFCRFCSLA